MRLLQQASAEAQGGGQLGETGKGREGLGSLSPAKVVWSRAVPVPGVGILALPSFPVSLVLAVLDSCSSVWRLSVKTQEKERKKEGETDPNPSGL